MSSKDHAKRPTLASAASDLPLPSVLGKEGRVIAIGVLLTMPPTICPPAAHRLRPCQRR